MSPYLTSECLILIVIVHQFSKGGATVSHHICHHITKDILFHHDNELCPCTLLCGVQNDLILEILLFQNLTVSTGSPCHITQCKLFHLHSLCLCPIFTGYLVAAFGF